MLMSFEGDSAKADTAWGYHMRYQRSTGDSARETML